MNLVKNIKTLLFASSFLVIYSTVAFSQNCKNFQNHQNCRIYNTNGFSPYSQSKNAVLEVQKTYSNQVVFYGKKDYKLCICTERDYYPIHYKLINAETEEVFYDNFEDDYIESVGFTIENNIAMILEITILAEDIDAEEAFDTRACIGINILWAKTPKLGF